MKLRPDWRLRVARYLPSPAQKLWSRFYWWRFWRKLGRRLEAMGASESEIEP
jgi:hypothetical protein